MKLAGAGTLPGGLYQASKGRALAENRWNATAKRAEAQVVHNFGRADEVDRDGLRRLIKSINRVLEAGDAVVTEGAFFLRAEHERLP